MNAWGSASPESNWRGKGPRALTCHRLGVQLLPHCERRELPSTTFQGQRWLSVDSAQCGVCGWKMSLISSPHTKELCWMIQGPLYAQQPLSQDSGVPELPTEPWVPHHPHHCCARAEGEEGVENGESRIWTDYWSHQRTKFFFHSITSTLVYANLKVVLIIIVHRTQCILWYWKKACYLSLGMHRWLSGKESLCNSGATGNMSLIPGSRKSLEEGIATHSSILAWRIPWTQESGGL